MTTRTRKVDKAKSPADGRQVHAPLSLAAFGKIVKLSRQSISKAVKTGRLVDSLVYVKGRPKIADVALAKAELAGTTDLTRASAHMLATHPASVGYGDGEDRYQARRGASGSGGPPDGDARYPYVGTLGEETAREKYWKANLSEVLFREKKGELVPADDVRALVLDRFTAARTKLLGLWVRLKQRIPSLTLAEVEIVGQIVREALESLAAPPAADGKAPDDGR